MLEHLKSKILIRLNLKKMEIQAYKIFKTKKFEAFKFSVFKFSMLSKLKKLQISAPKFIDFFRKYLDSL